MEKNEKGTREKKGEIVFHEKIKNIENISENLLELKKEVKDSLKNFARGLCALCNSKPGVLSSVVKIGAVLAVVSLSDVVSVISAGGFGSLIALIPLLGAIYGMKAVINIIESDKNIGKDKKTPQDLKGKDLYDILFQNDRYEMNKKNEEFENGKTYKGVRR